MGTAARIVIVEDDPDTALLTGLVLETEGFTTSTFSSGEEALDYLRCNASDVRLILLDISLKGGLDGFEVCRRLRADTKTAALPVIFFTANATYESRRAAREAGGQGFLAKPFGYDQLLREVQKALAEALATAGSDN
jgi:CheY-like chemotaxis protein